jgi:hypothetical protein
MLQFEKNAFINGIQFKNLQTISNNDFIHTNLCIGTTLGTRKI